LGIMWKKIAYCSSLINFFMIGRLHKKLGRMLFYNHTKAHRGKFNSRRFLQYFDKTYKKLQNPPRFFCIHPDLPTVWWNQIYFNKWVKIANHYSNILFFTYIQAENLLQIDTRHRPANFKIICTLFRRSKPRFTPKFDNYVYLSTDKTDIPFCPNTRDKTILCENCLKCLTEVVHL
jgi:hypothetical protein